MKIIMAGKDEIYAGIDMEDANKVKGIVAVVRFDSPEEYSHFSKNVSWDLGDEDETE